MNIKCLHLFDECSPTRQKAGAERFLRRIQGAECDYIIANFGGGSRSIPAKAVKILTANPAGPSTAYSGVGKVRKRRRTAGSD